MATIAWICATLIVTSAIVSDAAPNTPDSDTESAISKLLQSPPIAEAACLVRDVKSAEVLMNKVCYCGGSTVACDVGPIRVGYFEVTFCNKKPNQPVEDLLVMKFACNPSDPSCGEGTSCDIGPISYNEYRYYMCFYETGFITPSSDVDICHPELPTTTSSTTTTTSLPDVSSVSPGDGVPNPGVPCSSWTPWNRPCWPWKSTRRATNRRGGSSSKGWGMGPWSQMGRIFGGMLGSGGDFGSFFGNDPGFGGGASGGFSGLGGGFQWQKSGNPAANVDGKRGKSPAANGQGKFGGFPRFDGASGLGGGFQGQQGKSPAGNDQVKTGGFPRFDGASSGLGGGASGGFSGLGDGFQGQKGNGQPADQGGKSGWLTGFGDASQWQSGMNPPQPGQPGVHVYERRRWRVGNTGGEMTWGKRPPNLHRHKSSVSSSEER